MALQQQRTLYLQESVTLGDGTLGWNGSQYTWTPDHTGDVEYLVLGGGAQVQEDSTVNFMVVEVVLRSSEEGSLV